MIPENIKYVGIPWFERKNYNKMKKKFIDGHKLHDSYKEWLTEADKLFNLLKSRGITVEKVDIDPATFPGWCKSRGLNIDANARTEFANAFVAGKYLDK